MLPRIFQVVHYINSYIKCFSYNCFFCVRTGLNEYLDDCWRHPVEFYLSLKPHDVDTAL